MAGSCCLDEERRLLRFFVRPALQQHAVPLLRLALGELGAACMMVCTLDPGFLSAAMDVASRVESHSLLFAPVTDPEGLGLEQLVQARLDDHARIVDFQEAATGAPRSFLEPYAHERLERGELLLYEPEGELLCVGELRRDAQQEGIAQVGLIVHAAHRSRGIGSRMLSSLVARSREQDLVPHCSTELANHAARRTIERAGFRANHRVLRVGFTL